MSAPPLAAATYQMYSVAFCAESVTGPIATAKVSPAESEMVRFSFGEEATPVTMRKSPALVAEGKASATLEAPEADSLVASCTNWIADGCATVAEAWFDWLLELPAASKASTR